MKKSKVFIFDDRNLPVNDLTPERIEEIEKLMIPRVEEAIKKLRQDKPYLFKNNAGK